jgi:hypothetical protein
MLPVMLSAFCILSIALPTFRRARRGRGPARLYWIGCSLLLALGGLGLGLTLLVPPEHFDEDGQLIGEMPAEFALAAGLLALGLLGALAGWAVRGLRWLLGGRRAPPP